MFPKRRQTALILANLALAAMFGVLMLPYDGWSEATARVIRQPQEEKDMPWISLSAEKVFNGAMVQASANVTFTLPLDIGSIRRTVLLGDPKDQIRYWGYCFPPIVGDAAPYDPVGTEAMRRLMANGPRTTLPGEFFLSEKERAVMKQRTQPQRTILDVLTGKAPPETVPAKEAPIRHQKEMFQGGETCYIMSETPIPIGIDLDGDNINDKLEELFKSDPAASDTDGDGLDDGKEILLMGSDPSVRDSDQDGIIDGIEDKNRNGRIDVGETSPIKKDSDGDGLCDGFCIIQQGIRNTYKFPKGYVPASRQQVQWEDKNVNGKIDAGDTDPLKKDTDGDGILDEQEFILCHGENGLVTLTTAGCK